MELINDRYKIERKLEENPLGSSYLVSDILKGGESLILDIIKHNPLNNQLISYLKEEFLPLSTLEHPNVIQLHSFSPVHNIDNKSYLTHQFILTKECYSKYSPISSVQALAHDDIIEILIQVCHGVKYLHFRGYGCQLHLDNILITDNGGKLRVKLLDNISAIQKNAIKNNSFNDDSYLSKFNRNLNKIKQRDIKSIAVLIINLFKIHLGDYEVSGDSDLIVTPENIEKYIPSYLKEFVTEIIEEGFSDVGQIISSLNNLINCNYPLFLREYHEKIFFNTKMIGRSEQLEKLSSIEKEMQDTNNIKATLVVGDKGIGKTRLLREFLYRLKFENRPVTYVSSQSDCNVSFKTITHVIKDILKTAKEELIEKYVEELASLVPNISLNLNIRPFHSLNQEAQKHRIINRISSFIKEWAREIRPVIIIDDLHNIDQESLELFEYLISCEDSDSIYFVFGLRQEHLKMNQEFGEFVSIIENNHHIIEVEKLTTREMGEFILSILGTDRISGKFISRCFRETGGLPGLTAELVRSLYTTKAVFINDNGNWDTQIDEYSEISILPNIDDAIIASLSTFDFETKGVLEVLSLFNEPVPLLLIKNICKYKESSITAILNKLIEMRIVQERVEGWGFSYSIENKNLVNAIYYNISTENVKNLHKAAAQILEDIYSREGMEDVEQLVHHLVRGGQTQRAIEYAIGCGRKLERHFLYAQALSAYEIAASLSLGDKNSNHDLELQCNIANLLKNMGNNQGAINKYLDVVDACNQEKYLNLKIDCLTNVGEIYFKKVEYQRAGEYFAKAKELAQNYNYSKGVLRCVFNLVRIDLFNKEVNGVRESIEQFLELAMETNNNLYLGELYNLLGIVNVNAGDFEEGLNCYKKSIEFFEKGGHFGLTSKPLNNIGVVYNQVFYDATQSKEHFHKMLKIAQEHNVESTIATACINLGECYFDEGDYNNALIYYNQALDTSEQTGDQQLKLNINIGIGNLKLKSGDYKSSYQYLLKAKEEIHRTGDNRQEADYYYDFLAEFYYAMGNYEIARNYALKVVDSPIYVNVKVKSNSNILLKMIDIIEGRSLDIENLIELVKKHPDHYYRTIKFCELVKLFVYKQQFSAANKIYLEIERVNSYNSPLASMMLNYVKGVMTKHNQGFNQLCQDYMGQAAELAFKLNNFEYQLNCYQTLGLWLSEQDDLFEALGNFIHGFDVLYKIINDIPSGFKESYLRTSGRYKVKSNLIALINSYYNQETDEVFDYMPEEAFDEANDFFDDKRIQRILKDQQFLKFIFRNRSRLLSKPINNLEELLKHINGSYAGDIETTLKFAADLTLADRGYIFIQDQNNELRKQYSVFAKEDEDITSIIREIEGIGEARFEYNAFGVGIEDDIDGCNKRGKMIIPLYRNRLSHYYNNVQRHKLKEGTFYGYIYLDTVKIFNNFSEKSFATIKTVGKLLSMLIENHDFKIDSSIDKMTGVYARKYFDNAIKEELSWARENNMPLSFVLFDIDFFKTINDNYGHQKGDEVLKKLCEITLANIRKSDVLCRYGGEEFVIILPNTNKEEGFEVAQRVREAIEKSCTIGNNRSITISLGISSYPEDGTFEEELVTKADQALYYAKETGKNRCCKWNNSIGKGNRRADKLAGIITGNPLKDQRNILVITEIIDLVREELTYEQRVYKIIGKIIDILGAHRGMLITFDQNNVEKIYEREKAKEEWTNHYNYNKDMIDRIVQNMSGEYYIDWEDMSNLDAVTKKPLWQSIIGVPIIRQSKLLGIIYLSVPIREKEFDYNCFNFLNLLSRAVATVI